MAGRKYQDLADLLLHNEIKSVLCNDLKRIEKPHGMTENCRSMGLLFCRENLFLFLLHGTYKISQVFHGADGAAVVG